MLRFTSQARRTVASSRERGRSAYLTVSELFPLEMRSQVISYLFSIAQVAGAIAPLLFATLIGEGEDRGPISIGYIGAGLLMVVGGVVAFVFGVDGERTTKSR